MVIKRSWKNSSNMPTATSTSSSSESSPSEIGAASDNNNAAAIGETVVVAADADGDGNLPTEEHIIDDGGASNEGVDYSSQDQSYDGGDGGRSSNSSNCTMAATTVTASLKRHVSNPLMSESVLRALKDRFNGRTNAQESAHELAIHSLDVVRRCVQDEFNVEVNRIVQRYLDTYFRTAVKNIKDNLGDEVLTMAASMMFVSNALIQNSRYQYIARPVMGPGPPPSTVVECKQDPTPKRVQNHPKSLEESFQNHPKKPKTVPANIMIIQNTHPNKLPPIKAGVSTKHIFWNVSHLTEDTTFIYDSPANQVLGFSEIGRDRLACRYPNLIRYLPDCVDRDWLHRHEPTPALIVDRQLTQEYPVLLLVYDEVVACARSDSYRAIRTDNSDHSATVAGLARLRPFRLPPFMLQKLMHFCASLCARTFGEITTEPCVKEAEVEKEKELEKEKEKEKESEKETDPLIVTDKINTTPSSLHGAPNVAAKSSLSSSHATLTALLSSNTSTKTFIESLFGNGPVRSTAGGRMYARTAPMSTATAATARPANEQQNVANNNNATAKSRSTVDDGSDTNEEGFRTEFKQEPI